MRWRGSPSSAKSRARILLQDWPEVRTPRWVIPNGVDMAAWRPAAGARDFRPGRRARDAGKGPARGGAAPSARRSPNGRNGTRPSSSRARNAAPTISPRCATPCTARRARRNSDRRSVCKRQGAERARRDRHDPLEMARAVRPHLPRSPCRRRGSHILRLRRLARDQRRHGALRPRRGGRRVGAGAAKADRRRRPARATGAPRDASGVSQKFDLDKDRGEARRRLRAGWRALARTEESEWPSRR